MSTGPDLLSLAKTSLAASSLAPDDATQCFYVAASRCAAHRLGEDLRALEERITAREAELVRRVSPQQLEIASSPAPRDKR